MDQYFGSTYSDASLLERIVAHALPTLDPNWVVPFWARSFEEERSLLLFSARIYTYFYFILMPGALTGFSFDADMRVIYTSRPEKDFKKKKKKIVQRANELTTKPEASPSIYKGETKLALFFRTTSIFFPLSRA